MSTVLITGCGRGIGFHVAHQMAKLGWDVISTVHSVQRVSGTLPGKLIEMDIADDDSVKAAAEQVPELDVLINNALWNNAPDGVDILRVPTEAVCKSLEVNVVGSLHVAQAFVPALLRSTKGARIVNVSSIHGQLTSMGERSPSPNPAYHIAKAGLNMVTGLLAAALRSKGIPVNAICPSGPPSIEEAAGEIVWAATELPREVTGKFLHRRQPIAW